jgi:cytochrome c oxidase subunit IV
MSHTVAADSLSGHSEQLGHVVPLRVLLAVFAVLLALTFVTVAATWFDFGGWALAIALGIATVKASLVALYFMHLRYDNPFYAVVFLAALLFLAVFLSLTLLDTFQYQPEVENWQPIALFLRPELGYLG